MDAPSSSNSSQSLTKSQLLVLGAMLFSMLFGAGNLILPPLLGLQAGADAPLATVGFLIAGIGLPVMGIIASALVGGIDSLAGRVGKKFATIFIALIYLTIGPCLAIPRTASTSFEMLSPLIPGGGSLPVAVAFSVVFFAVAFVIALKPNKLSQVLGRFSAPALIVLIAVVVGAVLISGWEPAGPAVEPYDAAPVANGFLTGYQTMDLLASLCFGIIVAANVKDFGVTKPSHITMAISGAGVIAGVIMVAAYCGLSVVGVSMAQVMPDATNGAAIIAGSANLHFGKVGSIIVAAIFLLACLNVCIGLISCCSEYFSETYTRIPRMVWFVSFTVFSGAVSLLGLDSILAFSVPLLGALYPPAIVLMLMGLAHTICDKFPRVWPWAILLTSATSVIIALRDAFMPAMVIPFDFLPGTSLGLSWVTITIIGLIIGVIHSKIDERKHAE